MAFAGYNVCYGPRAQRELKEAAPPTSLPLQKREAPGAREGLELGAQESVLAGNDANPEAVPLVAPAGSAVIWPSHSWHGSWESFTPGLRISLGLLFARPHLEPLELYRESVPDEMIVRSPPRFATFMGMGTRSGWNDNQDDWRKPWRVRDRSRYAMRAD